MLRGSRLRIPGGQDATRNSNSATTSETPLEQRLRDRDASNRLLVERDSLKEQLKEAWAAKDALQNVMEVECRTLVQRLQDLESDLSNGRAERDQFAEDIQHMEMERDKWKDTCMSTSKGLEGVLEERDSLKNELTSLTNENRQLKSMIESGGNPSLLQGLAQMPAKPETPSPVRPASMGTKAAAGFNLNAEPFDNLDDVEDLLNEMLKGDRPTDDEVAGILVGAASQILGETSQMIIEIDVDVSGGGVQEVNVCGDLGGEVEKLWRVFEINGQPDEDNPYIFNGDVFQRNSMDMAAALFALKILYPAYVYILRSNIYRGSSPAKQGTGGKLWEAVEALTAACPLGVMLNNEVLILHSDLFADDCRRAISPPATPYSQRHQLPALLPYPTADPLDPVFLQQLKGLETSHDTTVATIRISPNSILVPDNARFMVFRVTKQFGCVAYFGDDTETRERAPSRPEPVRQSTWAEPRNDGSQTARNASYGGGSSNYGSSAVNSYTQNSGSATYRSSTETKPKLQQPKASSSYSSKGSAEPSYSKSPPPSKSSSKASTHDAHRSAAARATVPKLNLGSLAAMERQGEPNGGSTGIPPPNSRARAPSQESYKAPSKVASKVPAGSLSSRVERAAARYAQEYMRGATTQRDEKSSKESSLKPPKASGPTSLSGLRRPLVMKQPRTTASQGWR